MVNLFEKFASRAVTRFSSESLIVGRLSPEYDFSGARTVKIITPTTVPMSDYNRSASANRYGTPTEMQDVMQEMTLSQDRAFSLVIDKGNDLDQGGAKAATKMLGLQMSERAIPELDTYCFAQLCQKAGTVVANSTTLSKSTVCARISAGTQHLDDAEVPQNHRTLFVSAATYAKLRLSDEFMKVESLAYTSLARGQVGEYDNMPVVKVPAGRWPANVNFMIVYKYSAAAPVKISETKLHADPPGISGNLLEGREYYDLFVFGARCEGVYVEVDTSGSAVVVAAPVILTEDEQSPGTGKKGDFTCTTADVTFRYTTDGSDPRYSATAAVGTKSDVTTSGTIVKVCASKTGCYPSALTSATM